jgi:hypothetical protein
MVLFSIWYGARSSLNAANNYGLAGYTE